ncbi:sfsA [Symbiodinium microadriaticum]|nr:sfsA [Symbiodinium microadriaticum]
MEKVVTMDVVTPKCLRNGHLVAQQSIGKKQRAGLAGRAGATPGWPSPSKCCRCRRRRGLAHLPERIVELLQGLGRQARSDVLSKRLAEWQRKELEQLLLRQRDVSQLPKSGPPVAAALKQVTLPKKVSQGVQRLARKPPLVPRKRARATRREQAVKATEHGIFCRHARGGTKYRACISFSNLRLQARPRSSLLEAQHDLTCLASIRQRVAAGSGLFEHRVRTAMAEIEAGPRSGITFQVACAIFRHVLLSPVFEAGDFDSALAAWRRVRAAQQRPEETCMGRPGHTAFKCTRGKTVGQLSLPGYHDVRLESGAIDVAYCVNPGRMEAFSRSEASVWLAEAAAGQGTSAPKRRLRWTWELIDHNGVLCGTNTQRPNLVVGELLRQRLLPGLDDWVEMKSEKSLSHISPTDDADGHLPASAGACPQADTKEQTPRQQKKRKRPVESRLDFWLRTPEGGDHYIEAKNCHMVYPDGHGYFPDSVSSRASRHVTELAALAQAGSQCTVIFVVQRGDLHGMVRPSSHHDPTFAKACRQAAATGVRFRAVLVACSLQGLTVQREADVDLSEYDASPIVQWVAENRDSTGWIRSASQRRVANGPFPHEKKAKAQRRPVRLSKKAACGVFRRSLKPQQEASCIDLEDDEEASRASDVEHM